MTTLETVTKYGTESSGKKYLIRYLKGEKVTLKQAVLGNCCACMGYYADGRNDCEIPECPLYPHMPYRKNKVKQERTEKQVEAGRRLAKFSPTARKTQHEKT